MSGMKILSFLYIIMKIKVEYSWFKEGRNEEQWYSPIDIASWDAQNAQ